MYTKGAIIAFISKRPNHWSSMWNLSKSISIKVLDRHEEKQKLQPIYLCNSLALHCIYQNHVLKDHRYITQLCKFNASI